jgi:NAD+ synthase (glutamine-hydrolysing)
LEPYFEGRSWDVTEENMQARLRGFLLMSLSNKFGSLLLTTGNKSELAMGYMTLYGDMCGSLGVLQDVTKEYVYQLSAFVNRHHEIIPLSILHKAPSAELKEDQKDTDTLPPFVVLDPIIADYIEARMSPKQIAEKRDIALEFVEALTAQMHRAEYKRRQAPIGLRVTQKAFSKGRNVPIVQKWRKSVGG